MYVTNSPKTSTLWKHFSQVALVETAVGLSFNCLSFRGDRQLQSQGRRQLGRSKENLERQYLKTKVLKSNFYISGQIIARYISTRWGSFLNYVHPLNGEKWFPIWLYHFFFQMGWPNYLWNVILFNWVLLYNYTPKNEHVPWKGTSSIGNTSFNHWFSGDMLVFGGVPGSFNQNKFHWRKSTLTKSWGANELHPEVWVPCPNLARWGHPLGETRGHRLGIWWGLGVVRIFLTAKTGSFQESRFCYQAVVGLQSI